MLRSSWPGKALRVIGIAALLACVTFAAKTQGLGGLEQRQNRSMEEYQRLARELALSEQRQQELAAEIDAMKNDSVKLTAALIQAVKTERKLSADIAEIESNLANLDRQESEIRDSLADRRGTLAEILAALQRMGLNPPPAILVRPEDALASVRSAILLGAVVPEIRSETQALLSDLTDLSRIIETSRTERERLHAKSVKQAEEQERLRLLLKEKQRMQRTAEARMESERRQAEQLAERALNLQELISSLESQIETLREALERQDEDTDMMGESLPFAQRQGLLPLPVVGTFVSRFGSDDGTGNTLQGDILRTHSDAIVTAPADGTVLYAGPFRSYGELMILDPGDGYHIVLAGMDRLNVSLGQRVLAGEPVGMMGEPNLQSIRSTTVGSAAPELYIEFRKDGKPIDPEPWWVRELSGRTGNDT